MSTAPEVAPVDLKLVGGLFVVTLLQLVVPSAAVAISQDDAFTQPSNSAGSGLPFRMVLLAVNTLFEQVSVPTLNPGEPRLPARNSAPAALMFDWAQGFSVFAQSTVPADADPAKRPARAIAAAMMAARVVNRLTIPPIRCWHRC
jgi:hypothetical protein